MAAGGGGAAGRRGARAAAGSPVPVSPARLARLKRFDLDWQAALGKLNASKFSALATADLATLKTTHRRPTSKQIEADALTMAQITPALPFAAKVVALVEARIRVQDVNPQKAAETTMAIVKDDQRRMRAALEANAATAPKLNKTAATRAADATAQLRTALTEWFNFYNGYDPMFTLVDGHAVQAGGRGAAGIRDVPAREGRGGRCAGAGDAGQHCAGHAGAGAEVRVGAGSRGDHRRSPQDELRDVVARFNAGPPAADAAAAAAGRRRAAAPARARGPAPDNAYYESAGSPR